MNLFNKFKKKKKTLFDKMVLRKNDIKLLIVDERWNALFEKYPKTSEIIEIEENLKELLKEQSRLAGEQKNIVAEKRKCMKTIIKLTENAYDENNEAALEAMGQCQSQITDINVRLKEIENELEQLPEKITNANLALLEEAAYQIYFKMKGSHERVKQLEQEINLLKAKLRENITEKQALSEQVDDAYTYLHDLVGKEALEALDNNNR